MATVAVPPVEINDSSKTTAENHRKSTLLQMTMDQPSLNNGISPAMTALFEQANAEQANRQTEPKISKLEDILVPDKPGMFQKHQSNSERLQWSKEGLNSPLTISDRSLSKAAMKCYREIQLVIGDPPSGGLLSFLSKQKKLGDNQRFEFIRCMIQSAIQIHEIRDELYLMVRKQIIGNPKESNRKAGWELFIVLCYMFPPSPRISSFMREFCNQTAEEIPQVQKIAGFCHDKLVKVRNNHGSSTIRLPSIEEISYFMKLPFLNRIFGESLENIMKKSENISESGHYPKILSFLSESIIQLKGAESEGIFRVPGDLDQIIHLQMQIDFGTYELGDIRDPAVPASLLKQWTRELADPIIPNSFYNRCLVVEDRVEEAIEIVDEIPELNRSVLKYLIKFLQVIGNPNFQSKTKMTVSNLSLVFAPNLLRCPSDNPIKFLADSKKQANFLKLLINYMQ